VHVHDEDPQRPDRRGIGVLIVNNVDGPATGPGSDGSQPDPTIPALGISQDDGADVRALLPETGRSPQDDEGACLGACVTITGEVQEVDAEGMCSPGSRRVVRRRSPGR
jgi:hypothetical protein